MMDKKDLAKGPSMSFYPDFNSIILIFILIFILILSGFYPEFIQNLSRFYPSNNLSLILTLLRVVTGEFQREWQSAEHIRARLGRGVNQEMIHILLFYLFLLFSRDDRFMRGDLEKTIL